MGGKAKILASVFFSVIIAISVMACSNVQSAPPATASATPAPSQSGTPASGSPTRTGPPGSAIPPRPSSASQPTLLIPNNRANAVQASGTITIAIDANLNFDTGGKIIKLSVKKGDRVTKGQLLAALDTSTLGVAVAQAQVNLDQAILAQTSAQLAVQTAQFNLDKTQSVSKIKDVITNLEWEIKIAQMNAGASGVTVNDANFWSTQVKQYQKDLAAENKVLTDFLTDSSYAGTVSYDITGQMYDRLTVQDMQMKQIQVQMAQQTADRSQDTIDQAQRNLDLAKKQFNNTTISAPFDGVVATLNAKEGDVVSAPGPSAKPLIYLIDPTSMQIVVTINELDTPKLKIGQKATVKVDAFPGVSLDSKVSDISLLPNIQGGVVGYDVTVSFNVPPTTDIRSGMNASAEIALGQ